jgi:hypothetical protein
MYKRIDEQKINPLIEFSDPLSDQIEELRSDYNQWESNGVITENQRERADKVVWGHLFSEFGSSLCEYVSSEGYQCLQLKSQCNYGFGNYKHDDSWPDRKKIKRMRKLNNSYSQRVQKRPNRAKAKTNTQKPKTNQQFTKIMVGLFVSIIGFTFINSQIQIPLLSLGIVVACAVGVVWWIKTNKKSTKNRSK